jgi:hypothetical protein
MPIIYGTVGNPSSTIVADAQNASILVGRNGDALVSEVHGKYWNAAFRGNVFLGATLAAGIVVPFVAATLAAKFGLWNPAASNRLVELIDLQLLQVPGTALITGAALGFQGPLATTGGIPTSVTNTAGLNASTRIASGIAPQSTVFTAATLTNVAIANLSPLYGLYNNVATTVITQGPTQTNFDGKFILPPDTLCTLCDTITGTQSAAFVSLTYAEWPGVT